MQNSLHPSKITMKDIHAYRHTHGCSLIEARDALFRDGHKALATLAAPPALKVPDGREAQDAAVLAVRISCVLTKVTFPGYTFFAKPQGPVVYLQAEFMAPDNMGRRPSSIERTRKWLMSQHMTDSEIVSTALKCVLTSIEHEAREQFRYKGQPIFAPHFDVDDLARMCEAGAHELGARTDFVLKPVVTVGPAYDRPGAFSVPEPEEFIDLRHD